jgi:hypothetical protein
MDIRPEGNLTPVAPSDRSPASRRTAFIKTVVVLVLLAAIVLLQAGYDAVTPPATQNPATELPPTFVRAMDLGFNAAAGSFLWVGTMPEILDAVMDGRMEYVADEEYVNGIDPKLSYPYAFTVLVLPLAKKYDENSVMQALAIGRQGIHDADPDWRIPYYMASDYFLELKDDKDALWYYHLAAITPGIPDYALRFSLNFGIKSNERQKTEELWRTIGASSNDPATKQLAQAYVTRLEIFDYLDAASKAYQKRYGLIPTSTAALVAGGIIPAVPQDPFGFTFIINKNGTSGINTTSSFNAVIPQ